MFEKGLSFAYVKRINSKLQDVLSIPLSDVENLEDSQYLLVIQSNTKEFSKITIFPLKREKIIKVVLKGINMIEENIDIMINELQNFELIHTSGLIQKDEEIMYECYLNLSSNDYKYKDLKVSLDKIKSIIKEIKIIEIGIQKK